MVELSYTTKSTKNGEAYLCGQLLIAMPGMTDPRFEKSIIYICAHNEEGAMGLVLNRPIVSMSFAEMLKQLGIDAGDSGGLSECCLVAQSRSPVGLSFTHLITCRTPQ